MKQYKEKRVNGHFTIQYDHYSETGILSNNISIYLDDSKNDGFPDWFEFVQVEDLEELKTIARKLFDEGVEYE